MALKIYFLSSEIAPFAEQYDLAKFAQIVPTLLKDNEHDIRLIMPKYGFISSRKYVLREVIRLRDIEARWGGEVVTANARSAFIPETKVQVYFLDLPAYFEDVSHLLYKAKNGRPLKENIDRFGLFSKLSLRTLEKLFWQPDIIVANDWQSAYAVVLQNLLFAREEFFTNTKAVLVLHSVDELMRFSPDALSDAEVDLSAIDMNITEDTRLIDVAAHLADGVVLVNTPDNNIEQLVADDEQLSDILGKREKKPVTLSLGENLDEGWTSLADEFEAVLQDFA